MIDLKNMLPGYSSQQLVAMAGVQTIPEDASTTRVDVGIPILREEQLIDVGFLVLNAPTTGSFTVSFGVAALGATLSAGGAETDQAVVANKTIDFDDSVADGTLYRVSDGSLSWTTVTTRRNTEDERRIARGERVFCCIVDADQAGATIVPFCIMRPNESLDPIA